MGLHQGGLARSGWGAGHARVRGGWGLARDRAVWAEPGWRGISNDSTWPAGSSTAARKAQPREPPTQLAPGQAHSTHSELEEQAAVPVGGLLGDLDGFPKQRLCCVHGILKGDSHV